YVIAETATAVLVPAKGTGRLTSLLPPVHVAVAEAAQVVATLEDALALYQHETQQKGWTANSAYLISGPSRTGDIEQTIVVGVHGPREVHLVLIDP
ncbi:MAG: LUD domain-containing protein, partial [Chloroflexi bacterium]|nr:LUD domain-containing protein [Chloroflexota bacterium]